MILHIYLYSEAYCSETKSLFSKNCQHKAKNSASHLYTHAYVYITNVYLTSFNLLVASNPVSKIWVTVIYLQYSQAYSILRLASLFTQPIKKIDFNLCLTIEGKVYIIRQSSVRIQYWPSTANGYTPSGMTNLLFVLFLLLTRWCAF